MPASLNVGPTLAELSRLRLFADTDLDNISYLLESCPVRHLETGEALIMPGFPNRSLYVVLNGRLSVHLDTPDAEPTRFIDAGEAVGEISMIDEKPSLAYVVASDASRILTIDHETFWALVNASHSMARNVLLMLVERARSNNEQTIESARLQQQYHRQTPADDLTGLRNRRAFEDLLRRQMVRSAMNREPLTLLVADMDLFKRFNQEFGRAAGDQALFVVAQRLQEQVHPTDIIARIGGDRFGAIMAHCTQRDACIVAERLREAVAEMVITMADDSILPPVTLSIGVVEIQAFGNATKVMDAADQAVARAKADGRNRISS